MDIPIIYNNHYITVKDGLIVDGFSDAFRKPSEDDICINEEGGYQFRFIIGGEPTEENPNLFAFPDMIPLYKYEGGEVVRRTEEEIEEDRANIVHEYVPTTEERLADLEAAFCAFVEEMEG